MRFSLRTRLFRAGREAFHIVRDGDPPPLETQLSCDVSRKLPREVNFSSSNARLCILGN